MYTERRLNKENLQDILQKINDTNWSMSNFLYYTFRNKDSAGKVCLDLSWLASTDLPFTVVLPGLCLSWWPIHEVQSSQWWLPMVSYLSYTMFITPKSCTIFSSRYFVEHWYIWLKHLDLDNRCLEWPIQWSWQQTMHHFVKANWVEHPKSTLYFWPKFLT